MEGMNPKESAKLITSQSEDVKILPDGIVSISHELIKIMKKDKSVMNFKGWKKHPLNPSVADNQAIDWIFLVDALNFSFWTPTNGEKYKVNYRAHSYTGYWSLCAAVNRALDEGVPITSAEYFCNITETQAKKVFRSDSSTDMPMLKERVQVMNEIGQVLLEKFNGSFSQCISDAKGSAQALLKIIVDNFPCYRDHHDYGAQRVSFYKRAQILIAEIGRASCRERV